MRRTGKCSIQREKAAGAGVGHVWQAKWCTLYLLLMAPQEALANTGVCPAENDTRPSSGLEWPQTLVDASVSQPCPGDSSGLVYRRCIIDAGSATGTTWFPPDVAGCANNVLSAMLHQVSSTVSMRSTDAEEVVLQLNDLRNMTESSLGGLSLYPSELQDCADILRRVAGLVDVYMDADRHVPNLTQSFARTMSTLTSPRSLYVWDNFLDQTSLVNTAKLMLSSAEEFAANLINIKRTPPKVTARLGVAHWSRLRVQTDTMDFEVSIVADLYNLSRQVELGCLDGASCLSFPAEVAQIAQEHEEFFGYYRAQFSTFRQILSQEHFPSPRDPNKSMIVNSDILAASVVGVDEAYFQALKSPVILTLAHAEQYPGHRAGCYSLNMSAEDAEHRWSDRGCYVAASNASHTVCHCYHLTNFALLMDMFEVDLDSNHQVALSFISYIGGTLSIIGCLLSIIAYEFFRLANERIRIHEMLAVAIILSQLVFFVGFGRTENKYVCRMFAVMLHLFLTAMFCWMLVEGIHLYLSLVRVFKGRYHFKKYCILGWGIPAVVVSISLAVFLEEYGSESRCWLSHRVLLVSFVPFVAVTILVNLGILVKVLQVMFKSINNSIKTRSEHVSSTRSSLKAVITLMPLLGLTWVFGFLSVESHSTLVFTYLFAIFNSLQGVFFFIFHCLHSPDVQRAFQRRYRRQGQHWSGVPRVPKNNTDSAASNDLAERVVDDGSVRVSQRKRLSAYSVESGDTHMTALDEKDRRDSYKEEFCEPGDVQGDDIIEEQFEEDFHQSDDKGNTPSSQNNVRETGNDDSTDDRDVKAALDNLNAILFDVDFEGKWENYITHM